VKTTKTFWAATVAGWAIIGVAIAGILRESARTHPADFAKWFLGAAMTHDFLLAPVVLTAGVALARMVPPSVRPVATACIFIAAVVALYAVPLLTGEGRRPSNPSALPDNYWAGLGLVAGALTVLTTTAIVVVKSRRPRARSGP
jgi:hypothetical protein